MESVFEALEAAADAMSDGMDYLHSTRVMRGIYASTPWNKLRKMTHGTYAVDEIINISDHCIYNSDEDFFCRHMVTYKWNGVQQEDLLDARTIARFCKQTNYPLSAHFSLKKLVEVNNLSNSQLG